MSLVFGKSLSMAVAAAALFVAGSVMPAAAHDGWGGGREWHRHDGGWDGRRDHFRPPYRGYEGRYGGYGYGYGYRHGYAGWTGWSGGEVCWTDVRRVWVDTPWGPRRRLVERRVCR